MGIQLELGPLCLRPLPVSEPMAGFRSTRPGSERDRAFLFVTPSESYPRPPSRYSLCQK